MRAMKDSGIEWIGQIPQEWDVCKIKNCFNVFAGATPKSGNSEFWDGDIVWVTPADYTTEQKYISKGRKNITREGFESCSTEMIPTGSLIFSKRAPIGLAAINTVELCTNQGCLSCVPLDENDVEYFYYAFGCFSEQFDLYGSGTTFKEISADAFVNFSIPCPVPETQRKISEYLRNRCAEIDALIAAKEKTNALLKERRQSIIYEAVTKGLNPNAPMKDSGVEWIGEIPEEWETRRIKYCFDVFAGATPKSGNSEFWDGDVVWVTPADYTTEQKYITQGRKYITQEGFESCSTEMIPAGSLIFSKRAPIGLVAINMVELCTNQGCLSCVPKDGNDVEYFYYAFSCFAEQFDLYGSGTTFKEISADAFVNFPIPFPSTEEQKEISEHLRIKCSELDTLISANEATIQKLKEYRQSIIYEAVTGKIEV